MRCFHHPEVEAVGSCKACARGLCSACAFESRAGLCCRDHEERVLEVENYLDWSIRFVSAQRNRARTRAIPLAAVVLGAAAVFVGVVADDELSSEIIAVGVLLAAIGGLLQVMKSYWAAGDSPGEE